VQAAGKDPFNFELRLQLLEVRMGQLLGEIQGGQLTMDAYVRLVTNKICEERALLAQLRTLGGVYEADASDCDRRLKLMQDEIGLAPPSSTS